MFVNNRRFADDVCWGEITGIKHLPCGSVGGKQWRAVSGVGRMRAVFRIVMDVAVVNVESEKMRSAFFAAMWETDHIEGGESAAPEVKTKKKTAYFCVL